MNGIWWLILGEWLAVCIAVSVLWIIGRGGASNGIYGKEPQRSHLDKDK